MRPRPPLKGRGVVSGTGLVVTCLIATLAALVVSFRSITDRPGTAPDTLSAHTLQTGYGPLSALDQDFLVKVRLAGLWELPAGRQAQTKGTTPPVRTAGRHLVEGHRSLDERVRGVAARLNLALPDEPTAEQKQWLATLDRSRGAAYDREFATLLRVAHGRVFPLVAQVRASTRNSLVRALADDANTTVLDHIKVLEATGYVDYDAVARDLAGASGAPAAPSPAPSSAFTLPPPAYRPPPGQ
jgi:predicted outer membrane protein